MVPAGSILTYQAKGTSGWFPNQSDVTQQLNTDFAQNNIVMRDFHFVTTPSSVVQSVDAYLGAPTNYQFTATLQVNTDFNSPQDVASIADHSLYTVTGNLPASTIPSVTTPNDGATSTGQPTQSTPTGVDLSSIFGGSSGGLGGILQGGINSFALLMVGVILAVVLIIAGKSRNIL